MAKSNFSDILNKDIQLGRGKWSDKTKEKFFGEFQMLFQAGIDVNSALEMLAVGDRKEAERKVINQIRDRIIIGESVYEAMKSTNQFSSYELFSIKIGEESGKLEKILNELQKFFEKKIAQKRQFINALMYPMFVILVAVAVIIVMLTFVVPLFEDMFKRFDQELPWITRKVLNASEFAQNYWMYIILGLIGSGIGFSILMKRPWFKEKIDYLLLFIPVLGKLVLKNHLFRMSQSLSLLISSNTSIDQSLLLVKDVVDFYPVKNVLDHAHKNLMKGESLYSSFADERWVPAQMKMMVKVGEEVNGLDDIFSKLSLQYETELEHQGKIMGNILEPILIIVLGFIVVTILIAMYTPLFNITSGV